jgi:hypothetical protein
MRPAAQEKAAASTEGVGCGDLLGGQGDLVAGAGAPLERPDEPPLGRLFLLGASTVVPASIPDGSPSRVMLTPNPEPLPRAVARAA